MINDLELPETNYKEQKTTLKDTSPPETINNSKDL